MIESDAPTIVSIIFGALFLRARLYLCHVHSKNISKMSDIKRGNLDHAKIGPLVIYSAISIS